MPYASTFLSHSSTDKPLVRLVAQELCRSGVLAWLDANELRAGQALDQCLNEAIQRQMTITVFLSAKSLQSGWVQDELAAAFAKVRQAALPNDEVIIPVYLGDPQQLLKDHEQVRGWLHAEGNRVSKLGVKPSGRSNAEKAKDIVRQLLPGIFHPLAFKQSRHVVIVLDQRGDGARTGEPENLPDSVQRLEAPALVFRPDDKARSQSETLHGETWSVVRDAMIAGLSQALGSTHWPQSKNIHLCGTAQLGLGYLIGHHFNRNTSAHLYGHGRDGNVFNNSTQQRHTPVAADVNADGDIAYEMMTAAAGAPVIGNTEFEAMALLLSEEYLIAPVKRYLNTRQNPPPLCWVKSGHFDSSEQVMSYINHVVALLQRLSQQHSIRTLYLFCGLPLNMMPLLAAALLHVVENIVFMEYRRDLQGKNADPAEAYVPLTMNR